MDEKKTCRFVSIRKRKLFNMRKYNKLRGNLLKKIEFDILHFIGSYAIMPVLLKQKTYYMFIYARVAQLVEYDLAKVGVAGSSPVSRSLFFILSIFFQLFISFTYFHIFPLTSLQLCVKLSQYFK